MATRRLSKPDEKGFLYFFLFASGPFVRVLLFNVRLSKTRSNRLLSPWGWKSAAPGHCQHHGFARASSSTCGEVGQLLWKRSRAESGGKAIDHFANTAFLVH